MNEVASEITRRLLQVSYLPGIGTVALRKVVMLATEMGLESISDDNEIFRKFNKSNGKKKNSVETARQLPLLSFYIIYL